MAWYRTGTIALTNGSTAVVGTGTDFVVGAAVGESVVAPDGKVYEIASVVSATSLTLGSNYLGTTASGQAYAIAPTQSYIRDLAGQAAALINTYSGLVTNAAAGKFPDGTLSVPSIRFTTDDNTGINHLTSDSFDLVTNGVSRLNVSNSGLSGDATGLSNTIAPQTVAATSKTTPVDADLIPLVDSAASNVLKKLSWANLKATAKTYFDTLYLGISATAANASQLLGKTWASPDPIGSTTPSTGAFTTLSATGAISGSSAGVRLPTASPVYFNAGFTSYIQEVTAGNIQVVAGGATSATFSSTGVAVAGAVSATGSVAGSISTLLNTDTANGNGLYIKAGGANAGKYALYVENGAGTLLANLDASGNLGLGVTPSAWSASARAFQFGSLGMLFQNASGYPELAFNTYQNTSNIYTYKNTDVATRYVQSNGSHQWYTAPSGTAGNPITFTQAMTLDASGNLLVGTTSTSGNAGFEVLPNLYGAGAGAYTQNHPTGTASGTLFAGFNYDGTGIGSITQSGTTAVLYNTTSDARLKTNIADASDAADLIDSLQVRQFDWLSDGSHQRYGFVAQELFEVAPEAVSKPQDPDEMMAVDYSKLVPMLVKELQSVRARLAQLEGI